MKCFVTGFSFTDDEDFCSSIELSCCPNENVIEIIGISSNDESLDILMQKTIKYATKKGFATVRYHEDDRDTDFSLRKKYGFKKIEDTTYYGIESTLTKSATFN